MAHPRIVAVRRQVADKRLREVAAVAAQTFGVTLKQGPTLANRYPDLASAELIENVADFIEQLTAAHRARPIAPAPAPQTRKAG